MNKNTSKQQASCAVLGRVATVYLKFMQLLRRCLLNDSEGTANKSSSSV